MELIEAILSGNCDKVEKLLRGGANIHFVTRDGTTSMHAAVLSGNLQMVQLVQKRLASNFDDDGFTPLYYAAIEGRVGLGRMLIRNGADPDATGARIAAPLHIAVQMRHAGFVKMLLQEGAAVDAIDEDGYTPLFQACMQEAEDIAELLLHKGADPLKLGGRTGKLTPMHAACMSSGTALLKLCLQHGGKLTGEEPAFAYPLILAALSGNSGGVCRFLLEKNAAKLTFHAGQKNFVPWQSAQDFDWKAELFFRALDHEVDELAVALVKSGMKIDFFLKQEGVSPRYFCPLAEAIWRKNSYVAKALLDAGADPNIMEKQGADVHLWPLTMAYEKKNRALVKLLLERGATDIRDKYDGYMDSVDDLEDALFDGDFKKANDLIAKGVSVNSTNSTGHNLVAACFVEADLKALQFLLKNGANINQTCFSLLAPSAQVDLMSWPLALGIYNATDADLDFLKTAIAAGARMDVTAVRKAGGDFHYGAHDSLLKECLSKDGTTKTINLLGKMGLNICGTLKHFLEQGLFREPGALGRMLSLMRGTGSFVRRARKVHPMPARLCVLGMIHHDEGIFDILDLEKLKAKYDGLPKRFLEAAGTLRKMFQAYVDAGTVPSLKALATLAAAVLSGTDRSGTLLPLELDSDIDVVGTIVELQNMMAAGFLDEGVASLGGVVTPARLQLVSDALDAEEQTDDDPSDASNSDSSSGDVTDEDSEDDAAFDALLEQEAV